MSTWLDLWREMGAAERVTVIVLALVIVGLVLAAASTWISAGAFDDWFGEGDQADVDVPPLPRLEAARLDAAVRAGADVPVVPDLPDGVVGMGVFRPFTAPAAKGGSWRGGRDAVIGRDQVTAARQARLKAMQRRN